MDSRQTQPTQFVKNHDQVIASLIDPVRGFTYTCVRCRLHMKEEAQRLHICEADHICVNGVKFDRDSSMRYCCSICSVLVPLQMVRTHLLKHPKAVSNYEEEEWNPVSEKPSRPSFQPGKTITQSIRWPVYKSVAIPIPQANVEVQIERTPEKKRRGGEIMYCLRKVRKVQICFGRALNVNLRALFIFRKKAFRKWSKAVSK